ncbi:hypothetical protein E6C50_02115 [Flavobacterium supellecticarium]|uniref:Lipoprotein n=1 Tax=Flavobacterium supellecticarium TaxID=2565924 RepID=A0A4V6RWW3_9FLAO|nr:hypothetical protein [Flavobacterium supellecticarium]THF53026.1 hypothetical protein E6C50_02115 [Flavobacterium supellecticarium]
MNKIMTILIILVLFGCTSKRIADDHSLIFRNDSERILLVFKNGDPFLKVDNPVLVNVLTENINKESLVFSAPGIKLIKTESNPENQITLELTPKKEDVVNNKIALRVSYKNAEKTIFHVFNIPIK